MQEPVVTPAQLRAGRALLGLSQAELAERAGLPVEAAAEAETKRAADALSASALALPRYPMSTYEAADLAALWK